MRVAAAGCGFAVLCAVSCSHPIATQQVAQRPVVAAERTVLEDLEQEQTLAAEFRPFQEIDVHAKVAGYVKKIYVDVGDRVTQGQTLAVLEIPEMADELTRAEASKNRSASEVNRMRDEITRAEAAHGSTHLTYERLAKVARSQPNLIALQEIDDARARDQAAEAQVSAARAALASAEQQVDIGQADIQKTHTMTAYGTITAPFAGVVTKRYADTGSMVPAGTASSSNTMPIVKLSQNSLLRLILPVPESLSAQVRKGDSVKIKVPALSREFTGRVTRKSDSVSTSTRTMETEIDVPNPSLELIPGMYAQAVLVLDRRRKAVTVPLAAVSGDAVKKLLYAVDSDDRVRIVPVKTGLQTANRVQIISGIEAGDIVITGPRNSLTDGLKVTPKISGGSR